jgi:hypothetical protein
MSKSPPVNEYLRLLSAGETLKLIAQRYGIKANSIGMALQRAGLPASLRALAAWVAAGNEVPDAFVGPVQPREHSLKAPHLLVLTLPAIKARCEEEGDCLLWMGAMSTRKTGKGSPSARHDGRTANLRRVVWQMAHPGRVLPPDHVVVTTCRDERCLSETHLVRKTRSAYQQQLAGEGIFSDLLANCRRRDASRAVAKKLTMEAAREIRASKAPAKQLAQQFSVTVSMINMVRANVVWSERPHHAMPANSVFALGAMA